MKTKDMTVHEMAGVDHRPITDEQRKHVEWLASVADRIPDNGHRFHMGSWYGKWVDETEEMQGHHVPWYVRPRPEIVEAMREGNECRTSACLMGWALVHIHETSFMDNDMVDRITDPGQAAIAVSQAMFGSLSGFGGVFFDWLFDGDWSATDEGGIDGDDELPFAKWRLNYLLEFGLPQFDSLPDMIKEASEEFRNTTQLV